jgi:hypothetical protein
MQHSPRFCRSLNIFDDHTIRRYFARIGVFNRCVDSWNEDVFEAKKWNLFEIQQEKFPLHRLQMKYDNTSGLTVQMRVDNGCDFLCNPRFHFVEDCSNTTSVVDCWKFVSEFIIRIESFFFPAYRTTTVALESVNDVEPALETEHIENRILYGRFLNCRVFQCLILSWFDRIDRMKFWKCWRKNFTFDQVFSRPSMQFSIFIVEYL